MAKPDLIFLHSPSVYDFRRTSIMYGPVSDVIPSSPIFEMYPFGLSTLGEYLERHGYVVRIINIAMRMLKNDKFDVERMIKSLKASAFAIDLHWLPHAHGALEVARIVKRYHPKKPVIFGGFSATYYHKELIKYPQVDFVIRGDSTEQPMLEWMETVKRGGSYETIANLTWKDKKGKVYVNPLTYVPGNIDHIAFDCTFNMRSVFRHRDLVGHLPFENWLEYPITPGITCRGCTLTCLTCGGSAYTFNRFFKRDAPAYRDPELIAYDMSRIQQYLRGPIFIVGDIRQPGEEFSNRLLAALSRRDIANQVCFEFFWPPPEELFHKLNIALPHYSVEMSLETHDEEIRRAFGKGYSTELAEASMSYALNNGCERLDIYFMIGLPKQTPQSVLDTISYCDYLYKKFGGEARILTFIAPMAPFLDPGSIAFENPSKYGYKLLYKTLEEHRQALTQPSWKYILNYETEWMSRDELVDVTYEAAFRLNRIKAKYGVIDEKSALDVETRIKKARCAMEQIDEIMNIPDRTERNKMLLELKSKIDKLSESTICQKKELKWSTHLVNFRIFSVFRFFLNPANRKAVVSAGEDKD